MIRFMLGIVLVMGAVGAVEQSVGDIPLMPVAVCFVGLALMLWSVNSIRKQGNQNV